MQEAQLHNPKSAIEQMRQASSKSPPSFMREFSVNMGSKRATLVAKRAGPTSESLAMFCFRSSCFGFLRSCFDREMRDMTEAIDTCCCNDVLYHCNEESSQKQQQKLSSRQHWNRLNHHSRNPKIFCGGDCPSWPYSSDSSSPCLHVP